MLAWAVAFAISCEVAYAEPRPTFDEAWRCVGEAMNNIETKTKETWFEAEVNHIAGEIAMMSPKRDMAKAERVFRALSQSRVSSKPNPGNSAPL